MRATHETTVLTKTDHPRIRGEHYGVRLAITSPRGSSPHTRGARHLDRRRLGRAGIIPAYAGSTSDAHLCHQLSRDHPRIRGEHWDGEIEVSDNEGSSPHTRGALHPFGNLVVRLGIIPAYAGSTSNQPSPRRGGTDHPRIRGEHSARTCAGSMRTGSSPHTRGALAVRGAARGRGGIIPAYAGSTTGWRSRRCSGRDHPRIRGEHNGWPKSLRPRAGSSPHTRGALAPGCGKTFSTGIIPAYAGSTPSMLPLRPTMRDHPRIRGEHLAWQRN